MLSGSSSSRGAGLVRLCIAILAVLGWDLASRALPEIRFAVASPLAVADWVASSALSGLLLRDALTTGGEALVGLLVGTSIGSACGLALAYWRRLGTILHPLVVGAGSFPVLAAAPLLILWLGVGFRMKAFLAGVTVFFVALARVKTVSLVLESSHLDLARGFRGSKGRLFKAIVVPGSMEEVLATMRLNGGLALLGAFIGEFISAQAGLGYRVLKHAALYDAAGALGASFGIVVLALCFDFLAQRIERERVRCIHAIFSSSYRASAGDA